MNGREQRFNIGGASVILIFVVCALSVSAVLSLRASYHEYRLASKSQESVRNYYVADGRAEETFSQIHELAQSYISGNIEITEEELYERLKRIPYVTEVSQADGLVNYQVEIDRGSVLMVELRLDIQEAQTSQNVIEVESWKMGSTLQDDYVEDGVELWDGIIEE